MKKIYLVFSGLVFFSNISTNSIDLTKLHRSLLLSKNKTTSSVALAKLKREERWFIWAVYTNNFKRVQELLPLVKLNNDLLNLATQLITEPTLKKLLLDNMDKNKNLTDLPTPYKNIKRTLIDK